MSHVVKPLNDAGPVDWEKAPVLVWQVGKVGSTSIQAALYRAGVYSLQIHTLNPERLRQMKADCGQAGLPPPNHQIYSEQLLPLIGDSHIGFRVVSAVRDPVARNLSDLFENWPSFPAAHSLDDIEALSAWFVRHFDRSVLRWFDDEVRHVFGADVFSTPFCRDSRTLELKAGRLKLLVLRCEDDNAFKEAALNRFLGRIDLKVGHHNAGRERTQAGLYEALKRSLSISEELSRDIYNSGLVRHFYLPEEIAAFRERWSALSAGTEP